MVLLLALSVCMCMILVILAKVSNIPLNNWSLAIQPNSAISVLTTVGKTALLVPVTSCLGQLKFRYFRREHRLDHVQLFDDASRGPWGSLMMLLGTRHHAVLGAAFAIVTILALAIEPSAQQILDFPTHTTNNRTAELGRADAYYSKSFLARDETASKRKYWCPDLVDIPC